MLTTSLMSPASCPVYFCLCVSTPETIGISLPLRLTYPKLCNVAAWAVGMTDVFFCCGLVGTGERLLTVYGGAERMKNDWR